MVRRSAMGLALVLLLALPAGARAPSKPQLIPESAYRPVTFPGVIHDTFPLRTPGPRVDAAPTAPVIIVPVAPVAPASPTVAEAKAWALATLGATQYQCLANVIKHEDGTWDPYRTNPTSGAYGIPQALPGSKMKSAGADWRSNRITQVRWMVSYVDARYGSACAAWAFWQDHRWY